MAFARVNRNPQKRSGMDTFGLVFLAATFLFPPFFLVGMVFLWLSEYWTRNEKMFATLLPLPLGLVAAAVLYGLTEGNWIVPTAATTIGLMLGALIASFTLAFRSGLRDSQLPEPA